jgi:hypothetical protein
MPSGILVGSCSLRSATGRRSAGRTTQGVGPCAVLTRFGGRNYQRPVLRGPPKPPDRAPPPDPAFATFTISFRPSNAWSLSLAMAACASASGVARAARRARPPTPTAVARVSRAPRAASPLGREPGSSREPAGAGRLSRRRQFGPRRTSAHGPRRGGPGPGSWAGCSGLTCSCVTAAGANAGSWER